MSRKYYTLARWDTGIEAWCAEFGDYKRSVVKDEMDDMRDSWQQVKRKHMKIVTSDDTQASITAAIAALKPLT